MTAQGSFASVAGAAIARYLALKEALGRRFATERAILTHLDVFLSAAATDLTSESFAAWCRTHEHLTAGVRRNWMRVTRNLCLYRRRVEPMCFVPDTSLFPSAHQPIRPHIFTELEVASLLLACKDLQPSDRSPLRRENFRLALVLLYTTGLRRGELLRLTLSDYSPGERTLLIRESKFHKSRVLPLSIDGTVEVERYLASRRVRRLGSESNAPLLWNAYGGGRPYTGTGLHSTMGTLFRATSVQTTAGALPRVHDFRHTFAVQALLRWYRTGADVQAKLPLLATYMGHVSIVSTQYYLRYLDPLNDLASERFERRYGSLVHAAPLQEGVS